MLSCKDFRFQAGADPRHLTLAQRLHRLYCRACGQYLEAMQAFDFRIESALRLDVAEEPEPREPEGAVERGGQRQVDDSRA
jgi:hypothetical protein